MERRTGDYRENGNEARMLTTRQAAEQLKVTRGRIHQLILCGFLPAKKFGRDYQLEESDVEAAKNRPPRGRPRKTGIPV